MSDSRSQTTQTIAITSTFTFLLSTVPAAELRRNFAFRAGRPHGYRVLFLPPRRGNEACVVTTASGIAGIPIFSAEAQPLNAHAIGPGDPFLTMLACLNC